ncbi:hypothetical protein D4R42_04660 [bacterium]|nr:MAG: hypothetical protein D4R42_04660 [bacterium]
MVDEPKVDEMDLDEFQTLGDELERSKTDESEIIELLTGKAMTATAVGKELGVEKYATIYGRLDRMASKGALLKKYKDKKYAFYTVNPDYDPDAEVEADEDEEEGF